jgi:hypothetical protein
VELLLESRDAVMDEETHGNLLIPANVPEPAAGLIILVSSISLMQRRRRFW